MAKEEKINLSNYKLFLCHKESFNSKRKTANDQSLKTAKQTIKWYISINSNKVSIYKTKETTP